MSVLEKGYHYVKNKYYKWKLSKLFKELDELTKDIPCWLFLGKRKARTEKIKAVAKELHKCCEAKTKECVWLLNSELKPLGEYRLEVLKHTVKDFFCVLKKMEQRYKEKFYKVETSAYISSDMRQQFRKIDVFIDNLQITGRMTGSEIAGSTIMVAASGVLTAIETPAAVMTVVGQFATASTGTAISGLSGAAATNATLAWLGGGSLATGGGGIAAGVETLATITNVAVGGVILVGIALTYICHVSSNLTKVIKEASALANSVRGIEQRLETFSGIKKRIDELKNITEKLESRAKKSFNRLKKIKNFDCDNDRHVRIFQETAILMKALINLINTPILDKQGNVSQEGLNIIETTKKLIKNTELGK